MRSRRRGGHVVVALDDGSVVDIGGTDRHSLDTASFLQSVEIIEPDGSRRAGLDVPIPVANAAALLLPNGRILLAGGRSTFTRDGASKRTFVYDVAATEWSEGPPLPVERAGLQLIALPDGRIAAVGGAITNGQSTWAVDVLELD